MRRTTKLARIMRSRRFRSALLRHGVAAAVEHRMILAPLSLRTVVDVGANRGQFSLLATEMYPGARVLSFEPLSGPATRFEQLFVQEPRVTLHRSAIGPVDGKGSMHVSGHDDSSSLLPITSAQTDLFPGTEEVGEEVVRVARLATYVQPSDIVAPAMLKLDVQGFELEALRGCEDLLDRFDYICAECSFVELYEGQALAGEVISWVRAHGFELACVYGTTSDKSGRAVQADMLFERSRSAED